MTIEVPMFAFAIVPAVLTFIFLYIWIMKNNTIYDYGDYFFYGIIPFLVSALVFLIVFSPMTIITKLNNHKTDYSNLAPEWKSVCEYVTSNSKDEYMNRIVLDLYLKDHTDLPKLTPKQVHTISDQISCNYDQLKSFIQLPTTQPTELN